MAGSPTQIRTLADTRNENDQFSDDVMDVDPVPPESRKRKTATTDSRSGSPSASSRALRSRTAKPRPPRPTRQNNGGESLSSGGTVASATAGQTLGSGEGAVTLTVDKGPPSEINKQEEHDRAKLLAALEDADGNLLPAIEADESLKGLYNDIQEKFDLEHGDYYALLDVDEANSSGLTKAAFMPRVAQGLKGWSLKLHPDRHPRLYPNMPEELKAATVHLFRLMKTAAEMFKTYGPLPREKFIGEVGGELPEPSFAPPQPPANGVVPRDVLQVYQNATETFLRAWSIRTRDGLNGELETLQTQLEQISGDAIIATPEDQVQEPYSIRYRELLLFIRESKLPATEKQAIYTFQWFIEQYKYPSDWLPQDKREKIQGWPSSGPEQNLVNDETLRERYSVGVFGLRAGGLSRGRGGDAATTKGTTADAATAQGTTADAVMIRGTVDDFDGLENDPDLDEPPTMKPDFKIGQTMYGTVIGIKKRGKGYLLMLNMGTRLTTQIRLIRGSVLGKTAHKFWEMRDKDLDKHEEWARKKASDADYRTCTAVVFLSGFEPNVKRRANQSYWYVTWWEHVKRPSLWMAGSDVQGMIGAERMKTAYERIKKKQGENLVKLESSIENQVHPDTGAVLTEDDKSLTPWLTQRFELLNVQADCPGDFELYWEYLSEDKQKEVPPT